MPVQILLKGLNREFLDRSIKRCCELAQPAPQGLGRAKGQHDRWLLCCHRCRAGLWRALLRWCWRGRFLTQVLDRVAELALGKRRAGWWWLVGHLQPPGKLGEDLGDGVSISRCRRCGQWHAASDRFADQGPAGNHWLPDLTVLEEPLQFSEPD